MLQEKRSGKYVSILSDGSLREKVPEGTPKAVKREYETSNGEKGVKWELVYESIKGKIVGLSFHEGDYGVNMNVVFSENDSEITVQVATSSSFGEDFMKRLPNVNLEEPVYLRPYAFEDENKKSRKGVSLMQGPNKLQNFFYDAEAKKNINGYPEITEDRTKMSKDDWKIYFLQCRKFLTKYTQDNIIPKLPKRADGFEAFSYPTAEDTGIDPELIPF